MSLPIDTILEKLSQQSLKVDTYPDYYQAQCPSHDDNNPSLTIKKSDDGKVSIKCHAGCEGADIMQSLGLTMKDLYPKPVSMNPRKKMIDKTYPYSDEKGKLLFECVRFNPKSFLYRQPSTNGTHVWNLKGVRRVIYNLPLVVKAIETNDLVFITEGEKDADRLKELGLVATTNPMGAGKWRDEYSESLLGAEIVMLADNDAAGLNHMLHVGKSLLHKAASIKLIKLPELNQKGDVTDWLNQGKTVEDLLALVGNTPTWIPTERVQASTDIETAIPEQTDDPEKDKFVEIDNMIYRKGELNQPVTDFAISLESIVKDDQNGQIFYCTIREWKNHRIVKTPQIEILPECLDEVKPFYKAIRAHSLGEIRKIGQRYTRPVEIFKWLIARFEKPAVRRPGYVGMVVGEDDKRPFWLFNNAVICPPFKQHGGKVVTKNESNEFIVDEHTGFKLPIYSTEKEMMEYSPVICTDTTNLEAFVEQLKTDLFTLIGGGDQTGKARNLGKILLGYAIYLLYEKELYRANDLNGHSVMLYIYGPKGSGKTTYFNTLLRALMGLHKTREVKGNTVTISAIENIMGQLSHLPVCYDEYNPDLSKIDFQSLNSYYHKTSRTVSDMDRQGRNKSTPIRASLVITSNFQIDLDKDQADATESRLVYFEYLKEFRSDDPNLFDWFKDNLQDLSKFTLYVLLNQTDEKRKEIKEINKQVFQELKLRLEARQKEEPKTYEVETRLIDNYSRIVSSYELVFGTDELFRDYVFKHLLDRFNQSTVNKRENRVIQKLIHLASAGKIVDNWHYHINCSKNEIYINISSVYQMYSEFAKERVVSRMDFKKILLSLFEESGGFTLGSPRWTGEYYAEKRIIVNKTVHSHILKKEQITQNGTLKHIFNIPDSGI